MFTPGDDEGTIRKGMRHKSRWIESDIQDWFGTALKAEISRQNNVFPVD